MQSFTNSDLQQIFLISSQSKSHNITNQSNELWKYSFTNKIQPQYSFDLTQILYQFAHNVTIHNREVSDTNANPLLLNPPGFDIVIPLNGTYMYCPVNVAWFFYSTTLNIMVIVFTGTYNYILSVADVNYFQISPKTLNNYVEGMMVHGGFGTLYESIRSELFILIAKYYNSSSQVFITGLSLGGATSSICALDLINKNISGEINKNITNICHYSFASPRVFNDIGARKYNQTVINSYRILNGSDIIPNVPMPIMPVSSTETQLFTHIGELKYFDENLGNYYDNHITAYSKQYI